MHRGSKRLLISECEWKRGDGRLSDKATGCKEKNDKPPRLLGAIVSVR
jgi:hypothetical protein